MSDGALTISLTGPLADDVRAAAEARGLTPEEYVLQQLAMDVIAAPHDLSWEEDFLRLREPGEDIDADVAFAEFRAEVARARSAKS
jgi:hypothetical protein